MPADVPSGFAPGLINYFVGGPNAGGVYSDGSIPTQVSVPADYAVADSKGNVYLATQSGQIYIVYAGNKVPQALKNITATPQAGDIYQIAGLTNANCLEGGDPTCGENQPLNMVQFGSINGLAIDSSDNLYYADETTPDGTAVDVVRRVDATTSIVTTVAGQLGVASISTDIGDGGPAAAATLLYPTDIKIDQYGNIFIDDSLDDVIRVVYSGSQPPPLLSAEGITAGNAQKGFIYSVAGQVFGYCQTSGTCGDGTSATSSATLGIQPSIAVDAAGNLFIADAISPVSGSGSSYIRIVYAGGAVPPLLNLALNPAGGNTVAPAKGFIYAATGYGLSPQFTNCSLAPCGDGGLAAAAAFGGLTTDPSIFVSLDSLGNLYISDSTDYAVRKIDTSGYVSTIAGIDDPNQISSTSNLSAPPIPSPATSVPIEPFTIAFDQQNNLYITDSQDIVWQVAPIQPQTIDFPDFDPNPVTYGVNPITLAATATSSLPITYTVTGPAHLNGTQLLVTGVGTVSVTATQAGNSQYAAAVSVTKTLTVDPASLIVTANNASKELGQPNPAFSATISGFVNGETQASTGVYSGTPAFSTTATTNSPIATYPITVSLGTLAAANYTFASFVPGTLTVTGNTVQSIVFAALPAITYGQVFTLNLSATASSGLPVSFQLISGPGKLTGSTLTVIGGGTIVITASQEGGGQYAAATPVTRNLVVNPAPLTITGPSVTLPYGTTVNPSSFPAAVITGFVGSDTQASVLTGSAQYTTATGTPNAGTYPITVGVGTLALLPGAASSYVFGPTVSGSLVISPTPQTISLNPVSSSQIYGNFVPLTAASNSGLPITFTVTGPGYYYNGLNVTSSGNNTVQLVMSGVGTVIATATQSGNGNFGPAAPVSQTFTVGPAPLDIGVAQNYSREQGAPNPVFQPAIGAGILPGQPGGFVNGDSDIPSVISGIPLLTTTATESSPPGTYPIVPSQGTLAAANYYFVFVNGQLTVTPPGSFTISAAPPALTVPTGLSRQATITLTPLNLYQGTVTLGCGQVPANVTCVISPATYVFPGSQTINGTENSAQGTITITASGATVVGSLARNNSISSATFVIPGTFAGLLLVFARRKAASKSSIWGVIAFLALGASMLAVTSCGGSSKMLSAAPGSATVMITGNGTTVGGNGTVTASLPLSVTIQ
ncbi:hypothetical protein ACPOL_0161 [Acidisarcina polymorpha]|uniref:MBG domain-containing protein n=1 Tax=Acidisarcina polymorpha TaxID=2211140 RepID=A0A2Z5FSU6_9BACT|nr:MBG domain-containing protein [Acidisarcina polymorpha]AXC09546.1 hypothetical protein ACPOL_0161 [Acidisarcina polymorpha]